MDRSFVQANDQSRERLAGLTTTLTPSQLEIDLGEGWTVASALAHLGFWDRWQAERWERMLSGDWSADSASVKAAEILANEALHAYLAGMAAADIPALALEAATRLDALVAGASDSLADQLQATPYAYMLHRDRHRNEHLDHIERSIAAAQEKAAAEVRATFVEKNAASRRRLAGIVEKLREEELSLPTEPTEEGSWTVGQVLAHLLFWDSSMIARWQQALEKAGDGPVDIVAIPLELTGAINDPLADLIGSWMDRIGPQLGAQTLAAAEKLDALAEANADRLPPGALSTRPNALSRHGHRDGHLALVEKAVSAARPSARPVDRGYVERNETWRLKLEELYSRLSAADLARSVGDGGWTVAQHIGHMAFWDRFLATRWRAALAGKTAGGQPSLMPHDLADLLNQALPPSWAALASADGPSLLGVAREAMVEVDSIVASLPEATPIDAILQERPALLDRSIHRKEHMDQIETALRG